MTTTPTRPDWIDPYREAIDAGVRAFATSAGRPAEDPLLIGAIGLRETWMGHMPGYVNGTGDHGHGHGMWQIDDRGPYKHLIRPHPWDVQNQVEAACKVLADARDALAKYAGPRFEVGVVCAYNAGIQVVSYVLSRDRDPNWPTYDHDYGTDVLRVRDNLRALAGLHMP